MRWLVVVAMLAACRDGGAGGRPDAGPPRPGPVDPISVRVGELLEQLRGDDDAERRDAIEQIRGLTSRHALDSAEGLALLRALPTIAEPGGDAIDPQTAVMAALAEHPRMEYLPVIEAVAPELRAAARARAIAVVGIIDDPTAARTFLRLLRAYPQDSPGLAFAHLQQHPQQAGTLFPPLLALTDHPSLFYDILNTALAYCEQGLLDADEVDEHAPRLLASYQAARDTLVEAQRPSGTGWMWGESYAEPRQDASLLLDLFGCLPRDTVAATLADALASFTDPRLLYFAIRSSLGHGLDVPPAALEKVAASAETRGWLFALLRDAGRPDLFPARWLTQQALAESALVDWLVAPGRLGRAPDEVELLEKVSIEVGAPTGAIDFYVFRFRITPPADGSERGWLAGVAGPYVAGGPPTDEDHGGTGSQLEPASSRTAAEHVGDPAEIVAEWRAMQR